jgi:hypothetical protein
VRRIIVALMLALAVAAITAGAAIAALATIDPDTLTPPPPDGAVCHGNGQYVICQTVFEAPVANEPFLDLPCGTTYLTASDHREVIRWYSDGLLVKRFFTQDAEGTLSLSATGGPGPTVRFFAHEIYQYYYPVPGDVSSEVETVHGLDIRVVVPGSGGIIVAGTRSSDGTQHGIFRLEDSRVADALCEALQPQAE